MKAFKVCHQFSEMASQLPIEWATDKKNVKRCSTLCLLKKVEMCILNNTYSNALSNQLFLNIFQYHYLIGFLTCYHVLQMCMHYRTHFIGNGTLF